MPKAPSSTPMVSIQRPCYAMASTDGQSADITMYGQIVDTQPTDWWTGEPIPGQYIIESEFLSDLQQVEHCSEITIRMDSVGGDAGVSMRPQWDNAAVRSRQCGLWQLSVGYQICKIQDPAHRRFRYTDMDYRKRFFVGISERMR